MWWRTCSLVTGNPWKGLSARKHEKVVKTPLLLRVTVEYVTGELKVYVVDRAVLADLLKRLDPPP
jgi:hypothetical protein